MEKDDLITGLGAVGSTILTGLAWVWNIVPLQFFFPLIAGAFITYIVQSKLLDRSEKRKLRVKQIEDFYIPLYLDIENIKENFLLNLENPDASIVGSWHHLVNEPAMFTLEYKFREMIVEFFVTTQENTSKLPVIRFITAEKIYRNVVDKLYPYLVKSELVINETDVRRLRIEKEFEGTGLVVQIDNPVYMPRAPLINCAILKDNPVKYLENHYEMFEKDRIVLGMKIAYSKNSNWYDPHLVKVPIDEHRTFFEDFWGSTLTEVYSNTDVKKYYDSIMKLRLVADELLAKLKKHIEKYVEIEKL